MRTHSTIGPKLVVIACLLASAFPVSVLAQEASPPIEALSLTSVCVDDPAVQRRWQIDNPNDLDVEVIWQVVETDQTATVTAPPGASFIFTTTVEGPNIVVIVWYDENGVEQSDVASGGVECERGACFIENYMDTGRCNCLILAQYLCEALEGGTYQGDHTVCDSDNDGVFGCDDLCPGTPEDEDANEDGCSCSQLDDDQDGANNCIDNCLETSNPDQADLDGDGIGDVCDGDRDGDGVPN
ncbi:MAG: thrombospondin type 3 repeat-containing protein, partial [Phycisphaerae bacterium]|nr:thrombospondin type 3 repeat-containing protein [Phycisphaerae bacterium]